MELETILMVLVSLINFILVFLIAKRLEIFRYGIFTYGFFNIFTAMFPVHVLYPLIAIITSDPIIEKKNFTNALVLVLIMLMGLLIGVIVGGRKSPIIYDRIREVRFSPRIILALFLLTLFSILVMLGSVRGGSLNPFELLQQARTPEFRALYSEYELGYPMLFLQSAAYVFQVLLMIIFYRDNPGVSALVKSLIVSALISITLIAYGSRNAFFLPIVFFLFVTHHWFRKIPSQLIVFLFLVAIPVFVILRIYSAGNEVQLLARGDIASDLVFILDEFIARFKGFVNIVDFFDWFEGRPFVAGLTLVQLLLRPIPRTLLADKPSSLDVFLSYEIYGRPEFGGNVAIFGGIVEMYYNFWYVGVFIWFIILGILLYRMHFGLINLIQQRKHIAAAFLLSNYVLLRGLVNLGVNTSSMQQIIMSVFVQVVIFFVLFIATGLTERNVQVKVNPGYLNGGVKKS